MNVMANLQQTLPPSIFEALRNVYQSLKAIRFLWIKHIVGYAVPNAPCFDEPGTEFFLNNVRKSRVYLEYGSGGSTVQAAKYVDVLVSVESDLQFASAVNERLSREPVKAKYNLIYADIGRTGEWGVPVQKEKSEANLAKWRYYPQAPWQYFRENKLEPDTILIDGRFRVACGLESLINLSVGSRTLLLFDDYMTRPYYHEFEKFADQIDIKGRMGVFAKKADFDQRSCELALDFYCDDWR